MSSQRVITTVDSHTAGHPTRVITGGLPPLKGRTAAEKCDWFEGNCDELRTFLLHEPRGHSAMVGAVLTESAAADYGAFFLGSYNYLPMCGHATIGLAATLDHMGLIGPDGQGKAAFTLEVPAGIVTVAMRYQDGLLASVSFQNVPAFVVAWGVPVAALAGRGACDIAWGGNWYALVDAADAGIDLSPAGVQQAMAAGSAIKAEINARITAGEIAGASQPVHSVLFYRTTREEGALVSRQLVVLAPNKFDRSPCGTGTSARLAQLLEAGAIAPGERIRAQNILGVEFSASATPEAASGPSGESCWRPQIEGLAHITGLHTFIRTQNDPLPAGFLCR
jgi:proline racemase